MQILQYLQMTKLSSLIPIIEDIQAKMAAEEIANRPISQNFVDNHPE